MSTDRDALVAAITDAIVVEIDEEPIVLSQLTTTWLRNGATPTRRELEGVCRQIDVRHKLSRAYGEAFARLEPEVPAAPAVVAGVAAALLQYAARGQGVGDGLGLKCVNSALKALALVPEGEAIPSLRAWAVELLDRTLA